VSAAVSTGEPALAAPDLTPAELDTAIAEVFGAQAAQARAYAELLVTEGIERGVLGPREADRIWPRHLFNSAALAALIPTGARVVDLGSGAGLPGLPLAIARPDLRMVLLEPMQRRVRFLQECLDRLDLPQVQIVAGRAEDGVATPADDVVVRAVAPLQRLIPLAFGLLVDHGVLLALKGASAAREVDAVRRMSTVTAEVLTVPAPGGPATVVRAVRPAGRGSSKRGKKGSR
jgi:16S rRNA (guanine527-N7)-methyltransferase